MPHSPSQRRGLGLLLGVIIAILAIRLILNPRTVPEIQPIEAPAAAELADRIDPNTASAPELAAIPGLGEKRAEEILEFREQFSQRHPGQTVFSGIGDLERVSGIGPATAQMMEPFLLFSPSPATSP